MPKTIVADASCLILLKKIDRLELLHQLFDNILITELVAKEFRNPLPKWIKITNPSITLQKGLINILDAGEASAIALATEQLDSLLIIDEAKGHVR
ncbi:MAG: hypothetical protein WD267_00955 [Balneolales bacterium]